VGYFGVEGDEDIGDLLGGVQQTNSLIEYVELEVGGN
jgi:hypothetical protein